MCVCVWGGRVKKKSCLFKLIIPRVFGRGFYFYKYKLIFDVIEDCLLFGYPFYFGQIMIGTFMKFNLQFITLLLVCRHPCERDATKLLQIFYAKKGVTIEMHVDINKVFRSVDSNNNQLVILD